MPHPSALCPQNYLLYHYLNVKHMKYQMGVWEFFDDAVSPGGNPVAEGMINSVMGSKPLARSSFLTAPPIIQRNVFSYPTAINCLSTSVTSKYAPGGRAAVYGNGRTPQDGGSPPPPDPAPPPPPPSKCL